MLKKLRYLFALTICMLLLTACGKDDSKEQETDKNSGGNTDGKKFVVEDIFEGYSKEDNIITTVYGTVEMKDIREALTVLRSDMAVTSSSVTSSVNSMLSNAGEKEMTGEFFEKWCKNVNINNEEELRKYVEDVLNMINSYNASWSNITKCFTLKDYNKDAYDDIVAENDKYYESMVSMYGYEDRKSVV